MKRSLPLFQRTLSHFLQPAILFDLHQQKSDYELPMRYFIQRTIVEYKKPLIHHYGMLKRRLDFLVWLCEESSRRRKTIVSIACANLCALRF